MGCSIRALWILNQQQHVVFSRRFPTVEKKFKANYEKQSHLDYCALPTDLDLATACSDRKNREGSLQGSGIREITPQKGSDAWVNDPITHYVISLELKQTEDKISLLWPVVTHLRGPYHILVLPSVEPHHLAAYKNLYWRVDCGGAEEASEDAFTLSSIILNLPCVTGAFSVAYALADVVSGEITEPEMTVTPLPTIGGILDTITGGIGISSIAARSKPVTASVPVTAAQSSAVAGNAASAGLGISSKGTLKLAERESLMSFITSSMPFGTPLDLNPLNHLAMKTTGFANQDAPTSDQKLPAWKPYLYKGKQKLLFAIHETVTAALYDRDEVADVISVGGQLLCRADLEGLPDITASLSCPNLIFFDAVTLHPCAQSFEHCPDKYTLTFPPPLGNFILAKYMLAPSDMCPPLRGFYQLSMVSEDEGAFLFKMKLMEGYKPPMAMEHCSLSIPFQTRKIIAVDGAPSVGVVSSTEHSIDWKIIVSGRTMTSKIMEATFSGTVKFAPNAEAQGRNQDIYSDEGEDCGEDSQEGMVDKVDANIASADWEDPFCWHAYSYAKASFKILGGTMSGVSVDPKMVTIYPATKAPIEISAQVLSAEYIFWNSLGRYPYVAVPTK